MLTHNYLLLPCQFLLAKLPLPGSTFFQPQNFLWPKGPTLLICVKKEVPRN